VRLAARLTGWKIDIKNLSKYDYEEEERKAQESIARSAAILEESHEDDDNDYDNSED
jgi:N utilization substance protein A